MAKRFLSIWFRHLTTDWFTMRQPNLGTQPFVLAALSHGRKVITAANALAQQQGVSPYMAVADARALLPGLQVMDDVPGLPLQLLHTLGGRCVLYTPITAIDPPDGLMLDITGCAHLWGGEQPYLTELVTRLTNKGYHISTSIADTVGAAWATARFGQPGAVLPPGAHLQALLSMPPAALRLPAATCLRLQKLGLLNIGSFIGMPRNVLRRRFGEELLLRLNQALGIVEEAITPLQQVEAYHERLPCLEPILTRTGIEIALQRLLEAICIRLQKEGKGIRQAIFKAHRLDGCVEQITIGTNRATHNIQHLFKLFDIYIASIEPAAGIELFILDAPQVEEVPTLQESLWGSTPGLQQQALSDLLDRIGGKFGADKIYRYLPNEHHWPERSIKQATSLGDKADATWQSAIPRPVQLMHQPEPIEVTAPIPDYPPMLFRHKGQLHKISKADGPERIEREWWLEEGPHRDYYHVEDTNGQRYWLFRSGHYTGNKPHQWFIHGYFA